MPLKKSLSFYFRKKTSGDEPTTPKELYLNQVLCQNLNENMVELRPPTGIKSLEVYRKTSFSSELIHELKLSKQFNEKRNNDRLSKSYTDVQSYSCSTPNKDVLTNSRSVSEIVNIYESRLQVVPEKPPRRPRKNIIKAQERKSVSLSSLTPKSSKELEELLKTFNDASKSQTARPPCNKFPIHEEVEFRGNTTDIRKHRQSKTTDFDAGRRKHITPTNPKNFEVVGLVKLDTTSHRAAIFKVKEDCLLYEDEAFYRVNQKTRTKDKLYGNVVIKSVRYQKSKESAVIEVKDMRNVTYVLRFQKLEFAKKFMENEKVQVYITDQKVGLMHSLRKLLGKRASQEYLEKKGIYKPEPFFGNTLKDIANSTNQLVPAFVNEAIKLLQRPENIKSLGLYRTSGNLAVIQKIRLEVDKKNLKILSEYAKDPDVLTGSLKLFFRELKEPLISHEICDRLLEYTNKQNPEQFTSKEHQKIRSILVKNLHEANLETFVVLMRHLLEVVKFKEHNKMDAYNLAVCWGPSIVFSVSRVDSHPTIESCRDIVCLSQNATRLLDFFLIYYDLYPAELGTLGTRPRLESISEKVAAGTLMRQASRDSDWSIDSSRSSQKTSGSNLSLSIDEVTKKLVDFIEPHVHCEQLYRKSGSSDKTNKIMKKLNKKKIGELDKYKNDVYELTDALRRYLKDQDCLVFDNIVESVLRIVPDNSETYLKPTIKHHVLQLLEEAPKKDTLLFILHHVTKVIKSQEEQYGTVREEIINSWTNMLYKQKKNKISSENFSKFLSIAVKALNDDLPMPDVVRSSFGNSKTSSMKSESMDELLKEIKNHQNEQAEKDRNSRYDNVDTDDVGEASILDEDDKTEQTKL
ncbi:breakpoint cluster region protein-like isoform X3 [Euwallacea fornicatus]|uniref:breakpoint cluster region protein-like isoform X3 n=1 Tax=Euwallacea fornicatus TaxID=995702 RepID=UPI00338DB5EC